MSREIIEQYKFILQIADSEWNRFYSRQHIFIGFQLVAMAALIARLETLKGNNAILSIALCTMLIISITNFFKVIKGIDIQLAIFKIMSDLEEESGNALKLQKSYKKYSYLPLMTNGYLSAMLAGALVIVWIIGIVNL